MTERKPAGDPRLEKLVPAETRAMARDLRLTITLAQGRGSALMRARESIERARAGDEGLLDERLQAGCASAGEQKLMADLRAGRVKGRKKRLDELLAADRRQLVAEYVKQRTASGIKKDAAVKEAEDHFGIETSEVYRSLTAARE